MYCIIWLSVVFPQRTAALHALLTSGLTCYADGLGRGGAGVCALSGVMFMLFAYASVYEMRSGCQVQNRAGRRGV
jgi:hypothetical protein